ncbi:MAG: PP2C family protein-serine/threonine phosphatase [Planctomycetota bacterium]|jgi:phosphoserine phosphatase
MSTIEPKPLIAIRRREELDREALERVLDAARRLSASSDLTEVLAVILDAMRDTLDAERATVFEYDPEHDELFSTVAHGLAGPVGAGQAAALAEPGEVIRMPADAGLAGQCARERRVLNIPDAYADDRFNPDIDRRTGFRTRSILAAPLLDLDGELIGVAEVLNRRGGPFDVRDEQVSTSLASLAAVAIKRARLIEDRLVKEKLERDLELARLIQQGTLPRRLPRLEGFDVDAWSEPAEATGGDAVDVVPVGVEGTGALLLLADATGHGIGPALAATQVRAMLRMAARLFGGAADSLLQITREINGQLVEDLPGGRFVTAWLAVLDAPARTLTSFSAGQGPIVHYRAGEGTFDVLGSDTGPLGISADLEMENARSIRLEPGDIFAAISDGVFEADDPAGRNFGCARVTETIAANCRRSATEISAALREAVDRFTHEHPACDDRSAIVVKCLGMP